MFDLPRLFAPLAGTNLETIEMYVVGGAVRDSLLGLAPKDIDYVAVGTTPDSLRDLGFQQVGQDFPVFLHPKSHVEVALARTERKTQQGHTGFVVHADPSVTLETDLLRRDFTINAMAQDLLSGQLIDPHRGQQDLAERRLVFLHDESVSDDPTRVIRASRYAARLGFVLSPEALQQVTATVRRWPWSWQLHDAPDQAPPALANRLRMELDRLFAGEPWALALDCLEEWQAMALLDSSLQHDRDRNRRIAWAQRLGLPLLPAWLAVAPDPEAVARRLGVPGQQQQWLKQLLRLREWLLSVDVPDVHAAPDVWTAALETQGWMPETVALMVCLQPQQWKPLLRWWGRWRHLKSPRSARDLIADGWSSGPGLGAELQRLRLEALRRSR